jgi:2-polyprenyl-6-methoxyphenol hydroxylase-like FAD-dependent oxidoreductase
MQVHTGKRLVSLTQDKQEISVRFEDGSTDSADLLIGCDGLHSAVRQQLVPGAKKRYAGYTCWRGITSSQPSNFPTTLATESWGRGDRFGIVPLSKNRIYWFACLNAPREQDPAMRQLGLPALKTRFASYHPPVLDVLERTPADALLWNDIVDLEPLSTYSWGRAVLVGDAAHATTPNMGQGACQALEGAAVLVAQLSRHPLAEALQAYNRLRLPRASGIVKKSWQLGKIAQASNPLGVWLRDHLLPLVPPSVNEKQLEGLLGIELPEISFPTSAEILT